MKLTHMASNPIQPSDDEPPRDNQSPRIMTGRSGDRFWWQVGADRVAMFPAPNGWDVLVERGDWGGLALDVDGHFTTEAEARTWCEQMAAALAQDHADEAASDPGSIPAPEAPAGRN